MAIADFIRVHNEVGSLRATFPQSGLSIHIPVEDDQDAYVFPTNAASYRIPRQAAADYLGEPLPQQVKKEEQAEKQEKPGQQPPGQPMQQHHPPKPR